MRVTLARWFKCLCVRHAGMAVALLAAGALDRLVPDGNQAGMPGAASFWVVVPTVVAGLAVDLALWRMRVYRNRERQRIFQFLNAEVIDDKSRLLQKLLVLRRRMLALDGFDGLMFDHLDQLILDQNRHLSALHHRAIDSDLMAPLLTGAYTDHLRETTWTASLQGEFEESRNAP